MAKIDTQISIWLNDNDITVPEYVNGRAQMVCLIGELNESINVQELTDLNTLKQSAVRQIALPFCNINNSIFFQKKKFKVIVYSGATQSKNYDTLRLVQKNDKTQLYEVELSNSNNWAVQLKQLKVNEIDLTDFEFNKASLNDNWLTNIVPQSQDPFYFPLLFFGNTLVPNKFVVEDFRPTFFVGQILKRIFAKIGMQLECDYLETKHGQRLLCYILDSEWYKHSKKGVGSNYNVGTYFTLSATPQIFTFNINTPPLPISWNAWNGQFLTVQHDFYYNGKFNTTYQAKGFIDYQAITNTATGNIYYEFQALRNGSYVSLATGSKQLATVGTHNGKFEIDTQLEVLIGDIIYCNIKLVTLSGTVEISKAKIDYTCTAKHLLENDIVKMSELIDKKLKALDFVKGILHLINGKIKQNGNKVEILASYDTTILDEGIKGLYNQSNTYKVPDTDVVIDSMITQYVENEKVSHSILFKSSTDANIKGLPENEQNLYAHIETAAENITEIQNPIFEPTKDFELNPLYSGGVQSPIVPFLLDNANLKISHKIGFRVFLLQDYLEQDGSSSNSFRWWRFENQTKVTIPFASQFPLANFTEDKYYLTFEKNVQSFFKAFYENDIRKNLNKNIVQIDIVAPYNFVKDYLYHVISIFYKDKVRNYIIDSIDNYVIGNPIVTLNLKLLND